MSNRQRNRLELTGGLCLVIAAFAASPVLGLGLFGGLLIVFANFGGDDDDSTQ